MLQDATPEQLRELLHRKEQEISHLHGKLAVLSKAIGDARAQANAASRSEGFAQRSEAYLWAELRRRATPEECDAIAKNIREMLRGYRAEGRDNG